MTDLLPVTQSDRDAVQEFHRAMAARLMADIASKDRPKLGEDEGDAGTLVQAFARHRLEALRTQGDGEGWQPIDNAPACTGPDDARIIVIGGHMAEPEIVLPDGDWWRRRKAEGEIVPTHWRSLPAAPTQASSREEGK